MIEMMGVWNWLTPSQKNNLQKMALTGQHWMLTPWRTIDVVHAVQKPLIEPEIKNHSISRMRAATHALPTFLATCSIKSTSQLDVLASWNEPVDAAGGGGSNRERRDHAFTVKTTSDKDYAGTQEYRLVKPDQVRFGGLFDDRIERKVHEFNDTRYRRIEYSIEATSSFREFMLLVKCSLRKLPVRFVLRIRISRSWCGDSHLIPEFRRRRQPLMCSTSCLHLDGGCDQRRNETKQLAKRRRPARLP